MKSDRNDSEVASNTETPLENGESKTPTDQGLLRAALSEARTAPIAAVHRVLLILTVSIGGVVAVIAWIWPQIPQLLEIAPVAIFGVLLLLATVFHIRKPSSNGRRSQSSDYRKYAITLIIAVSCSAVVMGVGPQIVALGSRATELNRELEILKLDPPQDAEQELARLEQSLSRYNSLLIIASILVLWAVLLFLSSSLSVVPKIAQAIVQADALSGAYSTGAQE